MEIFYKNFVNFFESSLWILFFLLKKIQKNYFNRCKLFLYFSLLLCACQVPLFSVINFMRKSICSIAPLMFCSTEVNYNLSPTSHSLFDISISIIIFSIIFSIFLFFTIYSITIGRCPRILHSVPFLTVTNNSDIYHS